MVKLLETTDVFFFFFVFSGPPPEVLLLPVCCEPTDRIVVSKYFLPFLFFYVENKKVNVVIENFVRGPRVTRSFNWMRPTRDADSQRLVPTLESHRSTSASQGEVRKKGKGGSLFFFFLFFFSFLSIHQTPPLLPPPLSLSALQSPPSSFHACSQRYIYASGT